MLESAWQTSTLMGNLPFQSTANYVNIYVYVCMYAFIFALVRDYYETEYYFGRLKNLLVLYNPNDFP